MNKALRESANLDVLRATAVILVLIDHFTHVSGVDKVGPFHLGWLGSLGVFFFFVHTCCVLMMSLERQVAGKSPSLFGSFYVRRMFRIYPVYILVLAVVAVLHMHFAHFLSIPQLKVTIAGWISNFALTQNLTYSGDVMYVAWSLPLEMQMYLVLPFLFLLTRRLRSLWPLLLLWALAVPIALLPPHVSMRASVLRYAPDFLPGVLAYFLFRRCAPRFSGWLFAPLLAGCIVLFECVSAFSTRMMPASVYAGWMVALPLGLLIPFFHEFPHRLTRVVARHIARYSYGIYLIHPLMLQWFKPSPHHVSGYFLALLGVAVASVAAYHLLEEPMIRVGRNVSNSVPGFRPSGLRVPVSMQPLQENAKAGT